MIRENSNQSAVSTPETWAVYHRGRVITDADISNKFDIFMEDLWGRREKGDIFELGCGASQFLAWAAVQGWRVNGIDYNQEGLDILKHFLDARNLEHGTLHLGDTFKYDWHSIENSIDIVVSFGFLEHFSDPKTIMANAKVALKPGGLVISQIPNLFSFNAKLMKKYAPKLWSQHVPHTPEDFDRFHIDAGLEVIQASDYCGGYDEQMLIPWGAIKQLMPLPLFKLLRYFSSFVSSPLLKLLPKKGGRLYNPNVIGVYRKPL